MNYGFIRCAAMTPEITVADCPKNEQAIKDLIEIGTKEEATILVFPELCITGYTCGDLFLQDTLLNEALSSLMELARFTKDRPVMVFLGLPMMIHNQLYNVAACLCNGAVLGLIPKTHIPNYSEFYEARHFSKAMDATEEVRLPDGSTVPFGTKLLFHCENMSELVIGAELCEDVWVANPPSISHALAGATLLVNCSASDETTGKDQYRRQLIASTSGSLIAGYLYSNAGIGESSQDLVFGGQSIIAENGSILAESHRFTNETIFADVDLGKIVSERRRISTYVYQQDPSYTRISFSLNFPDFQLKRQYDMTPFVPAGEEDRQIRCEEILTIQSMGLRKRLKHTNSQHVVLGISGGLDSTLALLVAVKAFDSLSLNRSQILAVTMPCFGTTDRTYQNACQLVESLGCSLKEIPIQDAVHQHFRDIGHNPDLHDITYENSQARERTQILMDLANRIGGLVIGTGDMSELALGWATYNGDHMSMYGVNVGVPKTLVRHLVRFYADHVEETALRSTLLDILDTPVSPELLPPVDGIIAQKTEDIVGPYELHDFFLYYLLRFGYTPSKIFFLAKHAFNQVYDDATILTWMQTFYRRFFSQQFKRSCLPDGPKVGSVAVSPRGDLRMPSDASASIWLQELTTLQSS